jgi:hypothetical protein
MTPLQPPLANVITLGAQDLARERDFYQHLGVARLATVSAYLTLEPEHRADVLRQVRAVLPDRVDIDTTVRLALGRRV